MKRDLSPDEAFDKLIADHYEALHKKLQGGNAELVAKVDEAVFGKLPDGFWHEAVITATRADGALVIGGRIVDLVKNALLAEAEAAARKEFEQLKAAERVFDVPDEPLYAPVRGPWRYAGRR